MVSRLRAISRLQELKGIGWVAAATWGVQATKLLAFAALAIFIDPRTFGIFAFLHAIIVITQPVAGMGLSAAIVIKKKLSSTEISTSVVLAALFGLLGLAVLWWVLDLIVWYAPVFGDPALRWLLLSIVLTNIANVALALPRRQKKFASLAAVLLVAELIGSTVGIAWAAAGGSFESLVARTLTSAAILSLAGLAAVSSSIAAPRISAAMDMIAEGIAVAGSEILAAIRNRGDELLVGAILGATTLGIYMIARRYLDALRSAIPAVISNHAFPVLSSKQETHDEFARQLRFSSRLVNLLALPIFLATAIMSPLWVNFLLGPEWRSAAMVAQWLAATAAIQSAMSIPLTALMSIGQTKRKLLIDLLLVISTFAFMAIGAQYGLRPMLIGMLVGTLFALPLLAYSIDRLLPVTAMGLAKESLPILGPGTALGVALLGLLWLSRHIPDEIAMVVGGLIAAFTIFFTLQQLDDRQFGSEAVSDN